MLDDDGEDDDDDILNTALDDLPMRGLPKSVTLMGQFLQMLMSEQWSTLLSVPLFESALPRASYANATWADPTKVHHNFAAMHFAAKIMARICVLLIQRS